MPLIDELWGCGESIASAPGVTGSGYRPYRVFQGASAHARDDLCKHPVSPVSALCCPGPLLHFGPHRSTVYVDAACCYRRSSVVYPVCRDREPCKYG